MYQRPARFSLLPEVIKNLLIINGLFFLGTIVAGSVFNLDLINLLGLHLPTSPEFKPYQIVTHLFMHGGLAHVALNMFALWMFGYTLENVWGGKRFLVYYLITGLGAAALHLGVSYWDFYSFHNELVESGVSEAALETLRETGNIPTDLQSVGQQTLVDYYNLFNFPTVGASGAVFGVLLAFGMMFPNTYIYLYFAFPIKAKYFVAGYAAIELYSGIAASEGSNIAHFAHLGGMLFGYLLIKYWRSQNSTQF